MKQILETIKKKVNLKTIIIIAVAYLAGAATLWLVMNSCGFVCAVAPGLR